MEGRGEEARGTQKLTHRQVLSLAVNNLMQASSAEQVHDLAFLMGLHAGEDDHIAHDGFHKSLVAKLQQALKGSTRHATLRFALHQHLSMINTTANPPPFPPCTI